MNADAYILGQLAAYAIQQGARHGGVANMFAVAQVARNRVEQGWFGGDWLRVIENARECEGIDYSADPYPVNLQAMPMRGFLQKIDEVYHREAEDIYSGGRAVYFCDLQVGAEHINPWFIDNIIRDPETHPRVGTVGPVTLFA